MKPKSICFKVQYGFTLSELLIALAILGVIATFTIPKVLIAMNDQKKLAILKEDVAAIQNIMYQLRLDGTLTTHSCPSTSSDLAAASVGAMLNYTKITGGTKYYLTNGSTINVQPLSIIDFYIDVDGPNLGTNTYGDDKLVFHYNDCDSNYTYSGLKAGKMGTITTTPPGFEAENEALWLYVFTH